MEHVTLLFVDEHGLDGISWRISGRYVTIVERNMMIYDFVIIGSGFGGSVSALRLAEKGYNVAVLEQGQLFTPTELEQADESLKKLFWMPTLGMTGFFSQRYFRHVTIVSGVGVGGGSIGYAAVLLRPKSDFYRDPAWCNLGVDWKNELLPHYDTAERMLGVVNNPSLSLQDELLQKTAIAMGAGGSFGTTPNGIYFGTPEETRDDPYFEGQGPERTGCHLCGQCMTGCQHGSKNSLDRNYLYLAKRLGASIIEGRQVTDISPHDTGGYLIHMRDPVRKRNQYPPIEGQNVIIAAGTLGTLELMFRCRDVTKTLPDISSELGKVVRTNSEAVVGILSPNAQLDLTHGTAISSHFFPDNATHITQNRFPKGYTFMKWFMGPLVDSPRPLLRMMLTLLAMIARPVTVLRSWFARNWHKRLTILTVMQHLDNRLAFEYGLSSRYLFLGRRLKSKAVANKKAPTYLPVANKAARVFAQESKGKPLNVLLESLLNTSTTAHVLGGCHMGSSREDGVIDTSHRVFGYKGLYVISGASVSANIGANPSLTIAAMAERAISLIPNKEDPSGVNGTNQN